MTTSHTEDESDDDSTDMQLIDSLDQSLERRDSWGQCINNCVSKFKWLGICPNNIAAFVSQVGM